MAPFLVGCGRMAELVQYAGSADAAQDLQGRVAALPQTPLADMPVTGSVDYAGFATLAYSHAGADVGLLGQASLTANFASQLVFGQIAEVFGGTGATDAQAFSGQLTVNGQIGLRRPNGFDAAVSGQLSGGGRILALTGPLRGEFRGADAAALFAISTGQMQAQLNGEDVLLQVRVMVEQ